MTPFQESTAAVEQHSQNRFWHHRTLDSVKRPAPMLTTIITIRAFAQQRTKQLFPHATTAADVLFEIPRCRGYVSTTNGFSRPAIDNHLAGEALNVDTGSPERIGHRVEAGNQNRDLIIETQFVEYDSETGVWIRELHRFTPQVLN